MALLIFPGLVHISVGWLSSAGTTEAHRLLSACLIFSNGLAHLIFLSKAEVQEPQEKRANAFNASA